MAEQDKNQGKTPVPPGTEEAQRARTTGGPTTRSAGIGGPIRASTQDVNERRMAMNDQLEEDQKRIGAEAQKIQEEKKKGDEESRKAAYVNPSPTHTVSAKENQPVATPVDTGEPEGGVAEPLENERRFDATGMAVNEVDKNADLPFRDNWQPPAPTQDPPLNVGARVPAGSSRVDLTRSEGGNVEAGASLVGQPGGHLGSPIGSVPPAPLVSNPPVAPRGGHTRAGRE